MSEPQAVSIQPHAEAVWAVIQAGALDESAVDRVQQEVVAAAAQKAGVPVILDMSRVSFVPSAGLGALVTLLRTLKKEGRRFVLVGLQPDVRSLIAVTHLDKLLEIQTTFDEALRRMRSV
jgi:anti-sigma B factor antagonist